MTKELVSRMRYEDLKKAYAAYTQLMMVYESACGGPYAAREYKEYFAIMDSRNNIRQEVVNRSNNISHGDGQ